MRINKNLLLYVCGMIGVLLIHFSFGEYWDIIIGTIILVWIILWLKNLGGNK